MNDNEGKIISHKIVLAILFLAVLAAYSSILLGDFVFDDKALIIYNPMVTQARLSQDIFRKSIYYYYWMGNDRLAGMYRPVQILSYRLDFKLWGLNPFGFHLTNIILHCLNVLVAYYLIILLFKKEILAAITAFFFAVHPVHTSVVSYIAGRADLLSGFFMLLSMLFFLRFLRAKTVPYPGRGQIYYYCSIFVSLLALFSRENALLLVLFLILILYSQNARPKDYLLAVPFLITALFYLAIRFSILGPNSLILHQSALSLSMRAVNFLNIIPRYLLLLLLPLNLHLLRITPFVQTVFQIWIIPVMVILFISGYLLIRSSDKKQVFLFGAGWFLISLIPVLVLLDSYPVLGGAMMAESWLYLPSLGFFLVFTALLLSILKRLAVATGIILIVFYGTLCFANNFYWRNDLLVFKRILQYTGARNPLRKDLIDAYLYYSKYDEALREINKFSVYYPDSVDLDMMSGNYYLAQDNPILALERYTLALNKSLYNYYKIKENYYFFGPVHDKNRKDSSGPGHFFLYYRMSTCYRKLHDIDRAITFGIKSLEAHPYFVLNLIQLGDLYTEKGNTGEAQKYYRLAYGINPHNKALKGLIKNAE